MAAETVETLELEIRTRATDAAETVARLATSVSDFGENISKYIGNLSNLASALKSIAESAKALDGVKNIKSVVSGAAMAAQKAKAVTIGKAFTPIVPPVKASSTVTGRTRNVSMNGGVYQYNQTADEIARQYNKSLQGTRYTNKDLSSKIQEIRQLILKGEEAAAMQMAKSLADELTSSSGQKAVHPLIERLNSAVEKGNAHKYIGVDERDIAGAGMTATEMDATLRSLGARFGVRRRNASKSYNTTHSIGSIEDFEDQMLEAGIPVSVEDLFYALKGQWSPQRNVRDEWTASSNEEMTERVFSSLIDDIYSGKTIDTNAPAAAAKAAAEMAQKAKEDAAQAAQYAKESEAAWKQFEREESKANREYRSENKLNWKEVGWDVRDHVRAEADAGTDNTAAEISEWNASEDERLLQYQADLSEGWKQYAEEIVQAQTIAGQSLKDVIEDVTGLNSATKDAEDSARAMMDAMAGTTPFKSAEESAQVINAELDKAEREAEELRKAYRAPNRPGFHSYEEYTGPDNREFNMQATREFNELLGEIVQKENFIKNTKVHMIELSEAGIGNTSGVFARLKAANEAARLREAAGSISDAEREMTGLEGAARATAEEFMKDTTQADVLQMKLESVAQKLDEALNADEYDPGKIARLANEYQNLKGKIEKIGEAASTSSESASGLRSALSAVSNAIKHSSIGSLVSQLFRVAKMRGLRYIVRSLSSALSEGVSNLYNWSSGVNGSFASSMDTAASKLMLIKNSVATAFTPLIEQAVPYLSQLTSYVYTACNALSQFWALLTGSKTWTKALETTEKWSDSAKKGAGSAKEAAEETKDLLAD